MKFPPLPTGVFKEFLNPALPLALWFAFHAFFPLFREWFGVSRPALLIVAYLAVCIGWARWKSGLAGWRVVPEDAFFGGLVLVTTLSAVIVSHATWDALGRYLIALIVVPWLAARLLSRKEAESFLRYVAVLSLMLSGLTLAGLSLDETHERVFLTPDWALAGLIGLPIAVVTVTCGAALLQRDSWQRQFIPAGFCWALIAGGIGTAVYLGSRTDVVSIYTAFALMCVVAPWAPLRRRLLLLAYAALIVVVTLQIVPDIRRGHFAELLWPGSSYALMQEAARNCNINQDSIAIRLFLLKEAWTQFMVAPSFGIGFGRFGLLSCFYAHKALYASPHSSLLHVAAELGLAGLICMVGLTAAIVLRVGAALTSPTAPSTGLAWLLLAPWMLSLLRDQMAGSYFALPYFYILSGLLVSVLSKTAADQLSKAVT